MKTPHYVAVLAAAMLTAGPALAGTPSNPEWSDGSDVANAALDIRAGWVQTTSTEVTLTVRLQDLGAASPLTAASGDMHYHYRAEWTVATTGARHYVETELHFVDTNGALGVSTPHVSSVVGTNVGTQVHAGAVSNPGSESASVTVDVANNLIIMKIQRGTTYTPGTALYGLSLTTWRNDDVHETSDPLVAALTGGGKMLVDSATAGGVTV